MKHFALLMVILFSLAMATTTALAGKKLFVGGLSWDTTSEEINRLVSGFGTVLSVKVRSIDFDGDLSASAIVKMATEEEVDTAAAALDGFIYLGEPLIARHRSSKPKEIVVVGSKVKAIVREAGLRSDGELVQAVSDDVHAILKAAIKRTKANGRPIVRPYDL
ncbi:MAG: hypothetical protein BMS9Abin08_1267 [Gammaproteobacteria bacterium]|nr:MAG: hypothetical protein BMS9Abin08_1267 [Gammaproteobacteria bacterium]